MTNAAFKLKPRLKVAHKLQETNSGLLSLMLSVNFDRSRVVIADHEITDNFLRVYLEDKEDFKSGISDCLMYSMPISQFASIISSEGLNSYPGTLFTERGRSYEGRIEINEPIQWYNEDATLYEQSIARDAALSHILQSVSK